MALAKPRLAWRRKGEALFTPLNGDFVAVVDIVVPLIALHFGIEA